MMDVTKIKVGDTIKFMALDPTSEIQEHTERIGVVKEALSQSGFTVCVSDGLDDVDYQVWPADIIDIY